MNIDVRRDARTVGLRTQRSQPSMLDNLLKNRRIPGTGLRTWAILTEGSAFASVAVLPYALTLTGNSLERINEQLTKRGRKPLTQAHLLALSFLQGHVNFGVASALGLLLGTPMGIGPSHIESLLEGKGFDMKAGEAATYAASGA